MKHHGTEIYISGYVIFLNLVSLKLDNALSIVVLK